jgi:predicted nuclease of predicted toxin-antitoxin system
MSIRDFALLTDVNLAPSIVAFLRGEGFDVLDATEQGWELRDDTTLLATAFAEGRVVLTQDGDFGTLSIRDGLPYIGIVRFRPGHITPAQTQSLVEQLLVDDPSVPTPFLIVVQLTSTGIRIRIR